MADGRSLLPAGVVAVHGTFSPEDAVEVVGPDGAVFAKGLARYASGRAAEWVGRQSDRLPDDLPPEVIHRDDLVVLAPAGDPGRPARPGVPDGAGPPSTWDSPD